MKIQQFPKCKKKQNAEMPPNVNMPKVSKSKQSQNAKNTQMQNKHVFQTAKAATRKAPENCLWCCLRRMTKLQQRNGGFTSTHRQLLIYGLKQSCTRPPIDY